MYRIPKELDLSAVIGQVTTQLRVGQFDLQFTFGGVNFSVQSPVNLLQAGKQVAHWEPGKWPEAGFFDVMNSEVARAEIVHDRLIVLGFANGVEMHLVDDSDHYECMQITFKGQPSWII